MKQTEVLKIEIPIKRHVNATGEFERFVDNYFLAYLQEIFYESPSEGVYAYNQLPIEKLTLDPNKCETPELRSLTEQLLVKLEEAHPLLTQIISKKLEWKATQSQPPEIL